MGVGNIIKRSTQLIGMRAWVRHHFQGAVQCPDFLGPGTASSMGCAHWFLVCPTRRLTGASVRESAASLGREGRWMFSDIYGLRCARACKLDNMASPHGNNKKK